ncbi:DegV family protein [Bacillaceae bacterium SIJ1]|uniref:DegV family protein n=1 Tax=Litoribacterium kuwaitense TaxID=1398745 RepID=UPI0013EDF287|nr:DegV family protein [Litoribacterium kuwaitense]NGP46108.1 DegV family protein [Litoribacterium kuwaitense]
MKPISIVTDSTIDLPSHLFKGLPVHIVPLTLELDGQSYTDGVDLDATSFLEKLKQSVALPKTSQPRPGSFLDIYNALAEKGHDVLSIHLSGRLSGTVEGASMAANESNANVTVIDSLFTSSALGFQVLEAAMMAQEKKPMEEIVKRLEDIKNATSLYIMVDTLEYLKKGGRIGRVKALLGSIMNIKPVARLEDGGLSPIQSVRTHSQMIKLFVKRFQKETIGRRVGRVSIAHAGTKELALRLLDRLRSETDAEIHIVETTPIITSHTGPGGVALMYYTDEM